MKKSILWILAAIMTCGIATVLTSCGSDSESQRTGSYQVKAEIVDRGTGDTDEAKALYTKYEQKVNEVIKNNVYEWTISPVESRVDAEVALNNERAIFYLNEIEAKLKVVKAAFDTEISGMTSRGYMKITVNISAIQTVTGTKITNDKTVSLMYDKQQ
jgi:CRISPR/Cas system CSM-associated protein Csm3 (group 7 of RAMP superfamily)